jgi:hypothetical protein
MAAQIEPYNANFSLKRKRAAIGELRRLTRNRRGRRFIHFIISLPQMTVFSIVPSDRVALAHLPPRFGFIEEISFIWPQDHEPFFISFTFTTCN